ncbi:MAG: class I SAM-dependent methyltransferase [Candidatus Omnitrophica bacterium]|nr:class I SAM-dependent methyltransferase [Candidatus Omnitrophota bacterium]
MIETNVSPMEQVRCNLCGADDTRLLFRREDRFNQKEGIFNVVRCRGCGLIYLNPRPARERMGYYYDVEGYEAYNKVGVEEIGIMNRQNGWFSHLKNEVKRLILQEHYGYFAQKTEFERWRWLKRLAVWPFLAKYRGMYFKTIPFLGEGKALDVGCGSAGYLAWLKQLGWQVYGVEIDAESVRYAKEEYGIDVFCGELQESFFTDSFFDAITMWHFLEHAPDPLLVLSKCAQLLKTSGLLVIGVPHAGSLEAKVFLENSLLFDVPRHLYNFTPQTLGELLRKSGFVVERIAYAPRSINTINAALNRVLEKKGLPYRVHSRWRKIIFAQWFDTLLRWLGLSSAFIVFAKKKSEGDC